MSLTLNRGTEPEVVAKTDFYGKSVDVGPITISTEDFCHLALYVLTNTDLTHNDPRLDFMKSLAALNIVDGHNAGGKRLAFHIEEDHHDQ